MNPVGPEKHPSPNRSTPLPWGPGVKILQEDRHGLIAVEKPIGILSHPNRPSDQSKSLLSCPYEASSRTYLLPGKQPVWLLNRLDSATSGLLLLARDEEVARAVIAEFAAQRVTKTYRTLVWGAGGPTQGVWKDRLQVAKRGGQLRTRTGSGDVAVTRFRVRRVMPGQPALSLLELQPVTGRTHQLRVQCARRNRPILGDQTYGDFEKNRQWFKQGKENKRLYLHSFAIELTYALGKERLNFSTQTKDTPLWAR